VSALVNLTTLYASYSQIKDVSALVNLTTLDARYSRIKDMLALVKRGCRIYRSGRALRTRQHRRF
jgi:hypothetical protein